MTTHKQKGFIYTFLVRWFVCSLGFWIAAGLFQRSISYNNQISVIIIAGALLALLNMVIKPLLVLVSMPIMLITLGLFMIVVNGLTVYLVSVLYAPLRIEYFWTAICTGIIIGLVNYLVTTILENE
jgi:putative membrane protein